MNAKKYKVTCLKCNGSSRLSIVNGDRVMYQDHVPIISARLRGDLEWGFECACGQDSRLARQEQGQIGMLVAGGEHAIKKIAASLKVRDESKFIMEAA